MAPLYPNRDSLQGFLPRPASMGRAPTPTTQSKATPYQARPELYGAALSVAGAVKDKAPTSSGKIELYSGTYYASCTFGGLLACV